jgi:hypothetical protein
MEWEVKAKGKVERQPRQAVIASLGFMRWNWRVEANDKVGEDPRLALVAHQGLIRWKWRWRQNTRGRNFYKMLDKPYTAWS